MSAAAPTSLVQSQCVPQSPQQTGASLQNLAAQYKASVDALRTLKKTEKSQAKEHYKQKKTEFKAQRKALKQANRIASLNSLGLVAPGSSSGLVSQQSQQQSQQQQAVYAGPSERAINSQYYDSVKALRNQKRAAKAEAKLQFKQEKHKAKEQLSMAKRNQTGRAPPNVAAPLYGSVGVGQPVWSVAPASLSSSGSCS